VKKVVMRVEVLPVPEVNADVYFSQAEYRAEFQRWLNDLWLEKDDQIEAIMQQYNNSHLQNP